MTAPGSDAQDAAAAFRAEHHLGVGPILDLVTMLEDLPNVHVAIEPPSEGDHHGMRATDPERGVTILGAVATPHAVRLRSTLAHELGHHIFNDPTPAVWSDKTREENRATEFARHLLIPIEGLIELLGEPGETEVTEAVLSNVVERFAVSPHMAAIQLRESGYIDAATATRFADLTTPALATRYGWLALYRRWSADSSAVRPPRRIVTAAINAYIAHDATIAVIANLQGTTPEATAADLEAADITPAEPADDQPSEVEVDWSALDDWDETPAPEDEHR